jgi:hypothetical protein
MATLSWIRADDGDWYRATEVVAVKTLPHPAGGYMVTIETNRHDNIDVTGHLDHAEIAHEGRDALVRLLAGIEDGTVLTYSDGRFATETVG